MKGKEIKTYVHCVKCSAGNASPHMKHHPQCPKAGGGGYHG